VNSQSDAQIIEVVLSGKSDAFEVMLDRYQNQIFAYVFRLLNFHRQDAEDLASETFCRAYVNLASFNSTKKFSSWLYRIAHNLVIDEYSKRSHCISVDLQEIDIPAIAEISPSSKADLQKILAKLSLEDREILILFYTEEKSIKEIATILKILPGTVKVRLHRAKAKAKKFT